MKYYFVNYNWDSTDIKKMKAKNWDEVKLELFDDAKFNYKGFCSENVGENKTTVYEVNESREINVSDLLKKWCKEEEKEAKAKLKEAEYKKFLKLKEKFEGVKSNE